MLTLALLVHMAVGEWLKRKRELSTMSTLCFGVDGAAMPGEEKTCMRSHKKAVT